MPYGRPASLRTLGLYLSRWLRYPLTLRQTQADLYHILDNSYGHLAYFLPSRRTVVTWQGLTPRSRRQWSPPGPAMWLFGLAFRGTLHAGHIIFLSHCARDEFLAEAAYDVDRTTVIWHGAEPAFRPLSEQDRLRQRSELLSSREHHLLLHVGHGAARKNVETLYRAVALLRRGGWMVRLLRVGRDPSTAQQHLIEELGIRDAVTHLSNVENHQDLPKYYGAADLFVFPSLDEGFGIPLVEAMACGTPVVCADLPVFREVTGGAAYLVDPRSAQALADAMATVLEDSALAASLRQKGLERAKLFTWERTAQETLAVYRRMLQENR